MQARGQPPIWLHLGINIKCDGCSAHTTTCHVFHEQEGHKASTSLQLSQLSKVSGQGSCRRSLQRHHVLFHQCARYARASALEVMMILRLFQHATAPHGLYTVIMLDISTVCKAKQGLLNLQPSPSAPRANQRRARLERQTRCPRLSSQLRRCRAECQQRRPRRQAICSRQRVQRWQIKPRALMAL